MSDRFSALGAFLFAVVVIVFGVLAMRWFNSVASVVEVAQPKPGIECVVVTTTDGVAVDCNWGGA
jgi:small-conductance mechanosensitive channel